MTAVADAFVPPGIGFSSSERDPALVRTALTALDGAVAYYSVGVGGAQRAEAEALAAAANGSGARTLFHALDLDLAGTEPFDAAVLQRIATVADGLDAPWVTADLAMWSRRGAPLGAGLLPAPLLRASADWAVPRVARAQEVLGRPVCIENPPYPVVLGGELDVLDLLSMVAVEADALICVDVGHLYGLRMQQGRPMSLPDTPAFWARVAEVHIAGAFMRDLGGRVIYDDGHDLPVPEAVWRLADEVVRRAPGAVVVLEAEDLDEPTLLGSLRRLAALSTAARAILAA